MRLAATGLALVALVACGSLGCAHAYPLITSLPSAVTEKPPTGTVALVVSGAAPSARIQQPGFVDSTVGSRMATPFVTAAAAQPSAVGAVVAGVAVGMALVIGVTLDALTVDAAQDSRTVLRAFDDARVSESLVDKFLEAGRSYRILPPIVERPDAATPAVDTLLSLETLRVRLVSDDTRIWSADRQLRVSVGGALVRASDWHELAVWSWEHKGPTASLAEWSRNDARLFRAELDRALGALASQAVTDIGADPVTSSAVEETPSAGR